MAMVVSNITSNMNTVANNMRRKTIDKNNRLLNLPEDLLDVIYYKVHQLHMRDVIMDIQESYQTCVVEAKCLIGYWLELDYSHQPIETIKRILTIIIHLYSNNSITMEDVGTYMQETVKTLRRLLLVSYEFGHYLDQPTNVLLSNIMTEVDISMKNEMRSSILRRTKSLRKVVSDNRAELVKAMISSHRATTWRNSNVN
jgi:hypothetical protein